MAALVSLDQPNLQFTEWSPTDELDGLTFSRFWQSADLSMSEYGWKKC